VLPGPGGRGLVVLEQVDQRTPVIDHRAARLLGHEHHGVGGGRLAGIEGQLDQRAAVGTARAHPAVGLQRPKDAHRVRGTPGPAASAIDQELVVGWHHRQPMAAQEPPSRVPSGQAGPLQPVDRSGHRGRLALERIGQDANLDGAAVVQQQPEGASEQGLIIERLSDQRQGR
jgi:hypothetical protein